MYKLEKIILMCLLMFVFTACKEEIPSSLTKSKEIPNPVTDVAVENLPGGAKLTYNLPNNDNLLYVKAVFESPKGNRREVKSSMYADHLVIDGIGNVNETDVVLYAVSRSEAHSLPTNVKIRPLTPPVQLVGASLSLQEDFGGVLVNFENQNESNIVLTILRKDENDWMPIETYYTNKRSGYFNARGQAAISKEFGVFAKDRWGNKSDTLKMTLVPLFEERLAAPTPITTLASDYNKHYQIYNYTYLFDGIVAAGNYMGTLLNSPASALPLSFTIDFKKPTNFSRLKYWSVVGNDNYFNRGTPEKIEIWGSNTLDDDWSKWTKIGEWVTVKPSGLPVGQLNQEDIDASVAGYDCNFPPNVPPYRYLRWKSLKNFGSVDYIQMSEVAFWGKQ